MAKSPAKRNPAANYIHTGGFNRLADKSLAPGSVRPASYYLKWKIIFALIAFFLLLPGFLALLFG